MTWLSWEKMCAPKKDGGLGFRDLKAFNIALLAKQGWRLQSNTRFLVHRVLKACYFPDCDFIDAELGQTPSYAWRSIMVAQDVVRDGHQWQVGDGTSIQIWRDKWLPKSSTFQVIFMPNTLPETATVSQLIDEAKGEWNVDLVKHVFLPDDAHTILGIPRSSKRNRDRMIWAYTPKGTFTVNSAYKVALSLSQSKSTEGTLDATSHSQFWQKIWGLRIPNKLKTFAQRASRNILPTRANLCSRGVLDDPTCDACGLTAKTSGHLFWDCRHAREVWAATGIPFDNMGVHYRDFIDLVWYLIFRQHVGQDVLELIITIAWCMWYNRNRARHGSPRQSSNEILHKARTVMKDFQVAHFACPRSMDPSNTRWVPPSNLWFKVNTNAAIFKNLGTVGIGTVIRDRAGTVIVALSQHLHLPLGPLEAEAKAMGVAVSFAWDVDIQEVIFETDSHVM